jgi:hypothetical protein
VRSCAEKTLCQEIPMVKKHTPNESKDSQREQRSPAKPVTVPTDLVELRPGLYLNKDHIVSVRVLPVETGNAYAVMQLSSGEKMNLTRDDFSALCGVEPRPPMKSLPAHAGKRR